MRLIAYWKTAAKACKVCCHNACDGTRQIGDQKVWKHGAPAQVFHKAVNSNLIQSIDIGDTMQPGTRILFALLGFGIASNAWADVIFLQVKGTTGPVTQAPYVGDIEIIAYSQGFLNTGSAPQCSDTSITKNIDVTSTFFARSVLDLNSSPFTATFFFATTPSAAPNTTIKMNGVTVTSVQHGASNGGGGITESISMKAASLTVTFTDGSITKSYTTSCT